MEECREGGRGVTDCWYDFRGVSLSSFLIKTCQLCEWMGELKHGVKKISLIAQAVSEKDTYEPPISLYTTAGTS